MKEDAACFSKKRTRERDDVRRCLAPLSCAVEGVEAWALRRLRVVGRGLLVSLQGSRLQAMQARDLHCWPATPSRKWRSRSPRPERRHASIQITPFVIHKRTQASYRTLPPTAERCCCAAPPPVGQAVKAEALRSYALDGGACTSSTYSAVQCVGSVRV